MKKREFDFVNTGYKSDDDADQHESGYQNVQLNVLQHQVSNLPRNRSLETMINEKDLQKDHIIAIDEFLDKYDTDLTTGLSSAQAEARLLRDGPNVLTGQKPTPKIAVFLKQLFTGFNLIFWVAAILCILAYEPAGGDNPSPYNLALGIILLGVAFFSASLEYYHLQTASKLMDHFLNMMPHNTNVLRNGNWCEMKATELVVGDVIRLNGGNKLPADMRIVECFQAKVDKSALTGESKFIGLTSTSTDEDINETCNMAFFGTSVVEGMATGIICKTGNNTLMGNIAKLTVKTSRKMTTLERDIYFFTIIIACMAGTLATIICLYWGLYIRPNIPYFMDVSTLIGTCIGLIVAFVPDGLPVAVTSTLTLTAKRMRNLNVLVKNLSIIETLGATTVICSDKTGTITMNRMSLSHLWILPGEISQVTVVSFSSPTGQIDMLTPNKNTASAPVKFLLCVCALCNTAIIDEETKAVSGSSTESALMRCAMLDLDIKSLQQSLPIFDQIPFNSTRKFQVTVHTFNSTVCDQFPVQMIQGHFEHLESYKLLALAKGGPEIITEMCSSILSAENIIPLTDVLRNNIHQAMLNFASSGERVIALAFTLLVQETINIKTEESLVTSNLIFAGLASLIDPPKDGVAEAVLACHQAGIKVAMVTGDHPSTAMAIAKKVNIFEMDKPTRTVQEVRNVLAENEKLYLGKHFRQLKKLNFGEQLVVLGKEIDTLSDDEWNYILAHREFVFARTTPENKLQIVSQFQKRNEIVAVTGDGVNDAPALKRADVGIAMGIMGSEVSKEAANVILADDNFASIVRGISQGRLMFDNLRKVIAYLLPAGSFSEILPVIANVFIGIPLPLSAFQMIVICIATDVCGSLGMVHEHAERDVMMRKPRNVRKERIVEGKLLLFAYFQMGLLESIIGFFMYFYTMSQGGCSPGELLFAYDWGVNQTSVHENSFKSYCGLNFIEQRSLLCYGQSAFFASLVLCQLWNLNNSRTRHVSIFKQPYRKQLLFFMAGEFVILSAVVFVPVFNIYMQTAPINWYCFVYPILMGSSIMGVEETRKFLVRKYPTSFIAKVAW